MKQYEKGQNGKAICENCGLVETTFDYRDVPVRNSEKVVPNILVGVCNHCNKVVSIPAQSTPAIKIVLDS